MTINDEMNLITSSLHARIHDATAVCHEGWSCHVATIRLGKQIVDVGEFSTYVEAKIWAQKELSKRGANETHIILS